MKMVKAYVRAIGVFGRQARISDKYDEPSYPITNYEVERSYEGIEKFLSENATPVIDQQVNPLPYIEDGIISGPNAGSIYTFNNCLVANCFESGNGFNFDGVYQCLVSASFKEEDIQKTFEALKREGDWSCLSYWKENPRFTGEVEVATGQDLALLLKQEPKLLTARR
jgi:hypothetical protein